MTRSVSDEVAYNPYDLGTSATEEVEAYRRLLESCPVHHHVRSNPPTAPYPYSGGGIAHPTKEFWTLCRYTDVLGALQDPDRFRSGSGPVADVLEFPDGGMLVYADKPRHTGQRRIVGRAFLPRRVAALRPRIEAIAQALIDEMAPCAAADLVPTFAARLPLEVIAELVGIPAAERALFRGWSDATVAGFDPRSGEAVRHAARAFQEYREYLLGMIAARRSAPDPPDDLVTVLLQADDDGRKLTDDEIVRCVQQLVVAGNETTRDAISFGVELGCAEPRVREVLEHGGPDEVEVVVEELLRLQPPIRGLFRTTSEPVLVGGERIPAGAKVHLLFAAANRDPRAWDDPDEVRLDRDPVEARRHLSFGGGPHVCVGAPLARLELQLALPMLFQRLPGLRLDGQRPGRRQQHLTHRGWVSLPVRWEPVDR